MNTDAAGRVHGNNSGLTVLVTGAAGVLGKRVVRELQSSPHTIATYDGDISSLEDIETNLVKCSTLDVVVNCAAIVPLSRAAEDPEKAFETNAVAPGRFYRRLAAAFPGAYFLQISSSHVYKPSAGPLAEEAEVDPSSWYGKTKLAGEYLLQELQAQLGARLGIARLFSLISPDQDESFLYPKLRRLAAQRDERAISAISGWNNTRDFCSADYYAKSLARMVSVQPEGLTNVGSGEGRTVGQLAEIVYGSKLAFSTNSRTQEPSTIVADVSRLMSIGCKPDESFFSGAGVNID